MCEMENQSHIYANITWMNLIAAELICKYKLGWSIYG